MSLLPFTENVVFTHTNLVDLARGWLKPKCSVVVSEIKASGMEQPDAIGWQGESTILIECKASRADFLADRKKFFRIHPEQGLGDFRYFLAPTGIIKDKSELPENFGWLEVNQMTGKVFTKKKAEPQPIKNTRCETLILISLLRRIGHSEPVGTSIQCYVYETKNRAILEIEKV